jgi:hypothetical protein
VTYQDTPNLKTTAMKRPIAHVIQNRKTMPGWTSSRSPSGVSAVKVAKLIARSTNWAAFTE